MNNLQKIQAAAKMGYSAILNNKDIVVDFSDGGFWISRKEHDVFDGSNRFDYFLDAVDPGKITGYLYVGHLFGKPEIQEGQKFRVKETGEVSELLYVGEDKLLLSGIPAKSRTELEPVFD